MNYYLGVDMGSISTKGVIIDESNNIIKESYILTDGDPMGAVLKLMHNLKCGVKIIGFGVTGSARRLIGTILGASVVKNEITAHAIGTLSLYPDVRTIIEIGGQDSKIIFLENGVVTDYAMNTLCAAGTGSFLSSQAKRLGIDVGDFGKIALMSKRPATIAARCTVFAESDLVHKAQLGYKKSDIVAGLCKAVVVNYLNNLARGKKINERVVFQGGVSKNIGVVHFFEQELKCKVNVHSKGHLMGALGVAILSKKERLKDDFSFDIGDMLFETKAKSCHRCPNNCEIICVFKKHQLIDAWGNKCDKGNVIKI